MQLIKNNKRIIVILGIFLACMLMLVMKQSQLIKQNRDLKKNQQSLVNVWSGKVDNCYDIVEHLEEKNRYYVNEYREYEIMKQLRNERDKLNQEINSKIEQNKAMAEQINEVKDAIKQKDNLY